MRVAEMFADDLINCFPVGAIANVNTGLADIVEAFWPNQSPVFKRRNFLCSPASGVTARRSSSTFISGIARPLTMRPVATVGLPFRWRPTVL